MREFETSSLGFIANRFEHLNGQRLEYEVFQTGKPPGALFISGIHGDEFGVIGRLRHHLNSAVMDRSLTQSHLRIFRANPEAITAGTRGYAGVDLNRAFPEPMSMPVYPRAQLLRQAIDKFPIRYVFSFHIDHEFPFYFYDTPRTEAPTPLDDIVNECRQRLMGRLSNLGYAFHSGEDDPELKNYVDNGYCLVPALGHYDTTFENHAVDLGYRGAARVERAFVFEIPGALSVLHKGNMIGAIVNDFAVPLLNAAEKIA